MVNKIRLIKVIKLSVILLKILELLSNTKRKDEGKKYAFAASNFLPIRGAVFCNTLFNIKTN